MNKDFLNDENFSTAKKKLFLNELFEMNELCGGSSSTTTTPPPSSSSAATAKTITMKLEEHVSNKNDDNRFESSNETSSHNHDKLDLNHSDSLKRDQISIQVNKLIHNQSEQNLTFSSKNNSNGILNVNGIVENLQDGFHNTVVLNGADKISSIICAVDNIVNCHEDIVDNRNLIINDSSNHHELDSTLLINHQTNLETNYANPVFKKFDENNVLSSSLSHTENGLKLNGIITDNAVMKEANFCLKLNPKCETEDFERKNHISTKINANHTKNDIDNKKMNGDNNSKVPFPLLSGESVQSKEETSDYLIILTNYRLYVRKFVQQNVKSDTNSFSITNKKKMIDCQQLKSSQHHYQQHYQNHHSQQHDEQLICLPINNIDSVEIRDIYFLVIYTKYIESFVLTFQNADAAIRWNKKLRDVQDIQIDNLFCFNFFQSLKTSLGNDEGELSLSKVQSSIDFRIMEIMSINQQMKKMYQNSCDMVAEEFKRMEFDSKHWRICELNKDFKFCNSYPQHFIVPNDMSDKDLEFVANFRYSRRIPVVSWRSQRNGCVIARSSQPVVGWLGWRSSQDERMLQKILKICTRDTQKLCNVIKPQRNGTAIPNFSKNMTNELCGSSSELMEAINGQVNGSATVINNFSSNGNNINHSSIEKLDDLLDGNTNKLLILDARSYTAAFANRAMGGGCECPEYYTNCEIQFMSLNNIHSIRKSFNDLRYICEVAQIDQSNWFTLLDNTKWLHNLASLLKAALVVVDAISIQERPVLVHCSDGWDRTPQVIALAELMLDPYYRTFDGFRMLVEKEWLHFGHKFADRCRSSTLNIDPNERCPVFLQWIDCVHQLVKQFPWEFEFNINFLIKLVYHSFSCLFGTFICNNMQERMSHQIYEKSLSIWAYFQLERTNFINYIYSPKQEVLRPSCRVKDIIFWNEVYVPISSPNVPSIISYQNICNQHANNNHSIFVANKIDRFSVLNEANIDESEIDEFHCTHEIRCQSQSKCDLNRSASCENLLNNCNNKPMNSHHTFKQQFSSNTQPPNSFNSSPKPKDFTRHLSDSCLFYKNEAFYDRDKFMNFHNTTNNNDQSNGHNQDFSDEDYDENNRVLLFKNHEDSNYDIEDHFHGSVAEAKIKASNRYHNGFNNKYDANELYDNSDIFSQISNGHHKSNNDNSSQCTIPYANLAGSPILFDIDGQIIGKNDSRLLVEQLINYHKRMIKSLKHQLKFG